MDNAKQGKATNCKKRNTHPDYGISKTVSRIPYTLSISMYVPGFLSSLCSFFLSGNLFAAMGAVYVF